MRQRAHRFSVDPVLSQRRYYPGEMGRTFSRENEINLGRLNRHVEEQPFMADLQNVAAFLRNNIRRPRQRTWPISRLDTKASTRPAA